MSLSERVVVVLNGEFAREPWLLTQLDAADWVIAADGGANWLGSQGIAPHQIVGDMDSVRPGLLERLAASGCRIERYPSHKDETDAELALAAAAGRAPEEIIILGALGGRIDHALGNLSLLSMPVLRGIRVRVYDGLSWLWVAASESVIHGLPGDLVSLIPWGGDALDIRTLGLEYPLRGEPLLFGPSRGVSNVLTEPEARISIGSGQLIIVHTPLAASEERG